MISVDESRPNQPVEWQGLVLLFPCMICMPFFFILSIATFKPVTAYETIKSTALHGLFQDSS